MKIIYTVIFSLVTISLAAQCLPDRHSTSWFDAWISCEVKENPNPDHGPSHWIMYDLYDVYKLGESHFWNINDPRNLGRGLARASIDLSFDGVNWMFADSLLLAQGPGHSRYEGEVGPDLEGAQARYVLITIHDSHGDPSCWGFSELRMEREKLSTSTEDLVAGGGCLEIVASPNPFVDVSNIQVRSTCEGEASWVLSNVLGQVLGSGTIPFVDGQGQFSIDGYDLEVGQHLLTVRQGQHRRSILLGKTRP